MRLFLCLLAVVVTARGGVILGGDKCTWGPSYWCSSIQTASTCSALPHCVDNVWEQQKLDVLPTETCVSSQKALMAARRVLAVEGKVQTAAVTSLCDLATDDVTKQQCKDILADHLPEVLKVVESYVDPSTVSMLLGLCHLDDGSDSSLDTASQVDSESTVCQDCHKFIDNVRKMMDRPGAEEQITKVLEKTVCSKMDDLEIWCKAAVESGVPKLLKYLEKNDDLDVLCGLSQLCEDIEDKLKPHVVYGVLKTVLKNIKMDTDMQMVCHGCEKTVKSVLAYDKDSALRTSIRQTVDHVCSNMGLSEDTCFVLSQGFTGIPEEVLHTMSLDVNVSMVCQSTFSCTGSDEPEHPNTVKLQPPQTEPLIQDKEQPVQPQSPYCTECVKVFDKVRHVLKDDVSVSQATASAKQTMCKQVGVLEEECNKIVDSFIPVAVQWMMRDDGPQMICSGMRVCPRSGDTKDFDLGKTFAAIWNEKPVADFMCDECMILVEDARSADRDPDVQKAIVDFFNSVCDKLGQETQQCKSLVQQYTPELFEIIASELEPSLVCELLLHCTKPGNQATESDNPAPAVDPVNVQIALDSSPEDNRSPNQRDYQSQNQRALQEQEKDSLECSLCRSAVEAIDKAIASNNTEQELEQVLDKVCGLLPGDTKKSCEQFVDTYTPLIIQLLLQQLDPRMICDELQLCSDTRVSHEDMKEELKEEMVKVEEKLRGMGDSVECAVCKEVVGELDKMLEENKTEIAIEKALEKVCDILPQNLQNQCLEFVEEYAQAVIQLLVMELMQPEQICVALKLCQLSDIPHEDMKEELKEEMVKGEEKLRGMGDSVECELCKLVVGQLDQMLAENKTEVAIETALEKVCDLLPQGIQDQCLSFVDEYASVVVQLLVQELQPDQICAALGLCQQQPSDIQYELPVPTEPSVPSEHYGGPLCSMCNVVVGELDNVLVNDKSEAAVLSAVEQVCSGFPDNTIADCSRFINVHAAGLIGLLIQGVHAKDLCTGLKFCSAPVNVRISHPERQYQSATNMDDSNSSGSMRISHPERQYQSATNMDDSNSSGSMRISHPERQYQSATNMDDSNSSGSNKAVSSVKDSEVCIICQTLAIFAGEAVKEQSTVDTVEKLLENVCATLPLNLTATCKTMVEQFTPLILQLLAEEDNPLHICQKIKLCPSSAHEQQVEPAPLGRYACTYGPAYWCASMDNARLCGMEEECIEKYGLKP